jgi:UDP-N-acetylmuramoyl-tripeptide--D-alanyl-D-alanine ligase
MGGRRRTIAVLGDMLELGEQSAALHRGVGRTVGEAGVDRLYVAGRFAGEVADGAMAQDMPAGNIVTGTKVAITDRLVEDLQPGDLILVKGSRGMAMEQVVEAISGWAGDR